MCSKNFENWLTNKNFMPKNIFKYFNTGKWHAGEVTIFLEIFLILNTLLKCLKPTSNVSKDLHEAKISESSKKNSQDPNSNFLDYLSCPCKFPLATH